MYSSERDREERGRRKKQLLRGCNHTTRPSPLLYPVRIWGSRAHVPGVFSNQWDRDLNCAVSHVESIPLTMRPHSCSRQTGFNAGNSLLSERECRNSRHHIQKQLLPLANDVKHQMWTAGYISKSRERGPESSVPRQHTCCVLIPRRDTLLYSDSACVL